MPQQLWKMRKPDPFVMNEDTVNASVWQFLKRNGFNCQQPLIGKQQGVDVLGEKSGWRLLIESKGSHGNDHTKDTVFDQGQIKVHTYNQVGKLMEYQTMNNPNCLFAMANPDISRIRSRIEKISYSLDMLGFIRFWVQEDVSVM